MPRRPRAHVDGVPLHIVQRGHNREPCFFADADYLSYLHWLGDALAAHECALHAYVLMTNHVHLLLTPQKAHLVSALMMSLGRHYVQYFNRIYKRTGTLWDSRYKSSLVQTEKYLLTCQRYIELNPVRAGMVREPSQYRWSSYRANALGQPEAVLSPHPLYMALGDAESRRSAYRALFVGQVGESSIDEIRLAFNQGQPLGDHSFLETVELLTGYRREARPRGRPQLKKGSGSNLENRP